MIAYYITQNSSFVDTIFGGFVHKIFGGGMGAKLSPIGARVGEK